MPKKTKKKQSQTKTETPELGKANYGANEKPRCCPKCKCVDSDVYSGPKKFFNPFRKIRYRTCLGCGKKFTTTDSDATE